MPQFWTQTAWEIQLHHNGVVTHTLTIEMHQRFSALEDESLQTITFAAPEGAGIAPLNVACVNSAIQLEQGKHWFYDRTSREVVLNLAALGEAREVEPLSVRLGIEESGTVTRSDGYSCYWLGFGSRLGEGRVTTSIRLPPPANWRERMWDKVQEWIRVPTYDIEVASVPKSRGTKQQESARGTISLHSDREVPGGHRLLYKRRWALLSGPIGYAITTIALAIVAQLLWHFVLLDRLQPIFRALGWEG